MTTLEEQLLVKSIQEKKLVPIITRLRLQTLYILDSSFFTILVAKQVWIVGWLTS